MNKAHKHSGIDLTYSNNLVFKYLAKVWYLMQTTNVVYQNDWRYFIRTAYQPSLRSTGLHAKENISLKWLITQLTQTLFLSPLLHVSESEYNHPGSVGTDSNSPLVSAVKPLNLIHILQFFKDLEFGELNLITWDLMTPNPMR